MAEFIGGDVVVVPFPFTDLQSSKRLPRRRARDVRTGQRFDLPMNIRSAGGVGGFGFFSSREAMTPLAAAGLEPATPGL